MLQWRRPYSTTSAQQSSSHLTLSQRIQTLGPTSGIQAIPGTFLNGYPHCKPLLTRPWCDLSGGDKQRASPPVHWVAHLSKQVSVSETKASEPQEDKQNDTPHNGANGGQQNELRNLGLPKAARNPPRLELRVSHRRVFEWWP